ncbi:invasion associated locus B family protein [Mangrovicoccus algicola]|uniref:Uncharacterized protein n=1 Tax=Mangrovicoccus algicola TaxID=2771008 RepID=A0A8J6Z995_9RHOB|nr:hypothetical protein [Mangrovicoccus algicola]MBE3638306.1 hypothetical protein [Mangrovicoccus algicola]
MRICLPLLLVAAAAQAPAETRHGDWTVSGPGPQGCVAQTGGDGLPWLRVSALPGETAPPGSFPAIRLQEYALRHFATVMQEGTPVQIRVDDGPAATAMPYAWLEEDVFQNAQAAIPPGARQEMLRAMAAGSRIIATSAGRPVADLPLRGFTAAYLKMMALCGLDGTGVTG